MGEGTEAATGPGERPRWLLRSSAAGSSARLPAGRLSTQGAGEANRSPGVSALIQYLSHFLFWL